MHEVRKTVTILFADVVASTELAEGLDPEALREVVSRYFAEMADVLEQHGGTVEKFIGDAVMAVFGVPTAHEDDALRAIRAAVAMHRRLETVNEELEETWGARLQIRIGINTGEVIAGDPSAGHGFVTGSAVNIAQRLEQAAEPGEILLGDATHSLVRHAVSTTPIGPVSLRGRRDAETPQRLDAVRAEAEALARRFDTPLVGRRGELARLRAAYDATVETGRAHLVTLIGPAGIGKSRLARQLLEEVADEATTLVGRCIPYGEGITFFPVRQILPDQPLEGMTEEIFLAVRRRLEELARERPLVVCFEDVHWAEPTLLDLVEYLIGWTVNAPLLLIALARQEFLEERPAWLLPRERAETLVLGALRQEETRELLAVLDVATASVDRIVDAAEGNPLFVEQMAALAAEHGEDVGVPPSVRALLAARVDGLEGDEATVIERAAVLGREFALQAVIELVPAPVRPRASAALLALARKGLVGPAAGKDEDNLRFRHALIRDAVYESTAIGLRADLHERAADWCAASGADDVLVGYHLEQAFGYRVRLGKRDESSRALAARAGALLGRAGGRASLRSDVPAAVSLLRRSVALLAEDDPERPVREAELAAQLMRAGEFGEAAGALDRAERLARELGDRRTELHVAIERQTLRSFTEPAGAAEETARIAAEVIPELERLGDHLGLARAWTLASGVHANACRWHARAHALERALDHARLVPEAWNEASIVMILRAQALHFGPTSTGEAIDECERLLAEMPRDRALRAGVGATLAALLAAQGRFDEARRRYEESATLHDELGLRFRRAVRTLEGAEVERLAGDGARATAELRHGYAMLEQMEESGVLPVVAAYLADLLCEAGDYEEAERQTRVADELAQEDDLAARIVLRATRARLLARRGAAEAEALARDARALAAETDYAELQARTALALADVLRLRGADRHRPAKLAEEARRIYERKGNVVAAERVGRVAGLPAR